MVIRQTVERATAEQRRDWVPDRWLPNRTRDHPIPDRTAG
jgi:hypothetical protein